MARKKVAPEEEIVNAAGEEVIPESIPVDTVLSNEICTDTETSPSDLPEGNLPAEESTEPSETLPAMEAAEAKPFGLSAAEKTASQEKNDTVEERAEEAELHEETSEFLEAAEDLISIECAWEQRVHWAACHSFYCGYRAAVKVLTAVEGVSTFDMVPHTLLLEYHLGYTKSYDQTEQQHIDR